MQHHGKLLRQDRDERNVGRSHTVPGFIATDCPFGFSSSGVRHTVQAYQLSFGNTAAPAFHVFWTNNTLMVTLSKGGSSDRFYRTDDAATVQTKLESLGVVVDKLAVTAGRWVVQQTKEEGPTGLSALSTYPACGEGPRIIGDAVTAYSHVEWVDKSGKLRPVSAGTICDLVDSGGQWFIDGLSGTDHYSLSYDHAIRFWADDGVSLPTSGSIDLTYSLPTFGVVGSAYTTETITWNLANSLSTALGTHSSVSSPPSVLGDLSNGLVRIYWSGNGKWLNEALPLPVIDYSGLPSGTAATACYFGD